MKIYPIFKNGMFHNESDEKSESVVVPTARMWLKLIRDYRKRLPCEPELWRMNDPIASASHESRITWVGHSTVLIQVAGINIMTDPVFGNIFGFFRRAIRTGITANNLPMIDVVLLSHNHRDHMDIASLRAIVRRNPNVRIFVPQGDKALLERKGFTSVREFNWWSKCDVDNGVCCTFLPAKHWSLRNAFLGRNTSLWGSWMIEAPQSRVYFGGDTAYWKHFPEIAREFGPIDVALMPIGPCEPREFMNDVHLSSEQAIKAFIELQAQQFVPLHWGTFFFGTDYFELPIERLSKHWNAQRELLYGRSLHVLKLGQHLDVSCSSSVDAKSVARSADQIPL